jgi:hypothetical protein
MRKSRANELVRRSNFMKMFEIAITAILAIASQVVVLGVVTL